MHEQNVDAIPAAKLSSLENSDALGSSLVVIVFCFCVVVMVLAVVVLALVVLALVVVVETFLALLLAVVLEAARFNLPELPHVIG